MSRTWQHYRGKILLRFTMYNSNYLKGRNFDGKKFWSDLADRFKNHQNPPIFLSAKNDFFLGSAKINSHQNLLKCSSTKKYDPYEALSSFYSNLVSIFYQTTEFKIDFSWYPPKLIPSKYENCTNLPK